METPDSMAEQNLRLLEEIDANRKFILLAYQSDPGLLKRADPEIRRLFEPMDNRIAIVAGEPDRK